MQESIANAWNTGIYTTREETEDVFIREMYIS